MRSILSASDDTIDRLAEMADRIRDFRPSYVATTSRKSETNPFSSSQQSHKSNDAMISDDSNRIDSLERQISSLKLTINKLSRGRPQFRKNFRSRSRSFSRGRFSKSKRNENNNGLCYYHWKFA